MERELELSDVNQVFEIQSQLVKLFNSRVQTGWAAAPEPNSDKMIATIDRSDLALFCLVNITSRVVRQVAKVQWGSKLFAGGFLRRISGQRDGPSPNLALRYASFFDFSSCTFDLHDFYGANLEQCIFDDASLAFCNFTQANLQDAWLRKAYLFGAMFHETDLEGTEIGASEVRHLSVHPEYNREEIDMGRYIVAQGGSIVDDMVSEQPSLDID
ncbi:pentapeptide repeat-containing protein [Qipengyuania mesophila]|uniref:pentapeptide repeat-containing protein n=1 Tax=Qipengyuania mesophila TaxID=2867246 RepID=UPI003519A2BD